MTWPMMITVSGSAADNTSPWVRFSVPLERGTHRACPSLRIIDSGGIEFPAQSWTLARWPDKSVRVVHAVAPLKEGKYTLSLGEAQKDPGGSGLVWSEDETGICIKNAGEEIRFPVRTIFDAPGIESLTLMVKWSDGAAGNMQIEGPAKVVRSGPLYLLAERWVRACAGHRFVRFRLRWEFFEYVPGTAMGIMLVHDCPGADFHEIKSIEAAISSSGRCHAVYQQNYGFEYLESRFVETEDQIDVRVDDSRFKPYVANFEVLNDCFAYPPYMRPPPDTVGSAVFLTGGERVLQIEMEDFHLLRPKGIRLENGSAVFGIWPEWAGTLSLQQGRRRQVRLALSWGHRELPTESDTAAAATASVLDVHRAQLPAEAYKSTEFFEMPRVLRYRPDLFPRWEGWLAACSQLLTPAEFWNLGDTVDTHYQTQYISLGYCKPRIGETGCPPRFVLTSPARGQVFEKLEKHEPVWVNNEYDVLLALGTEYLRSANLTLYQQLRWFARHTVEVDFLCYSDHPAQHRAQPAHSEFHTSTGSYPSHFWTQGLAQYYFLTGDDDALEVIRALADKTIWYFEHPVLGALHTGINREVGWSILTLLFAHVATLDSRYEDWACKLIDLSIAEPMPADIPQLNFGQTSLLLGIRTYCEAHPNEPHRTQPLTDWFLKYIGFAVQCASKSPGTAPGEGKYSNEMEHRARGFASTSHPRPGIMSGWEVDRKSVV